MVFRTPPPVGGRDLRAGADGLVLGAVGRLGNHRVDDGLAAVGGLHLVGEALRPDNAGSQAADVLLHVQHGVGDDHIGQLHIASIPDGDGVDQLAAHLGLGLVDGLFHLHTSGVDGQGAGDKDQRIVETSSVQEWES